MSTRARLLDWSGAAAPKAVAVPYWSDRHPDHVAASQLLTEAVFNAGLRRYPAEGEAWKPEWICYYFINDSAAPSFVDRRQRALRDETAGAGLPRHPVHARWPERRGDASDAARRSSSSSKAATRSSARWPAWRLPKVSS